MKSLLSILASTSLIASGGAMVVSCAGQTHDLKYGEHGVLKELLNIDIDALKEIQNAATLWDKIEDLIDGKNEITLVNSTDGEDQTGTNSLFNVKEFSMKMKNASNENTTSFGKENERRFIFVSYTERLVRGNWDGTEWSSNEEIIELESDFASFAIVNKA